MEEQEDSVIYFNYLDELALSLNKVEYNKSLEPEEEFNNYVVMNRALENVTILDTREKDVAGVKVFILSQITMDDSDDDIKLYYHTFYFVYTKERMTQFLFAAETIDGSKIQAMERIIDSIVPDENYVTSTEKPTQSLTEKPTEKINNDTSSGGFSAYGSGDDVVTGLTVTKYAVLHIEHTGARNFAVISYEGDDYDDLLVNTIGNYSGDVLIDHSGEIDLEITADGDWNITSSGLTIDDTTSFSGHGDAVTGLTTSSGGIWEITHSGDRNFAVIEYGLNSGYMDLLVNEIGDYSGTVKAKAGDVIFFKVSADGDWTIKKKN